MSQASLCGTPSSRTTRLVADSFSKSVLLVGSTILLQRGIGFVRSFYVCGAMSPAEVGQWDLAFNFLVIMAPLAVLGIPGSFGRYVPRFELKGQQGRLLRQTLVACCGLTILTSSLVWACRDRVSRFFFGSAADAELVAWLAIGLPLIVFFNFATSWFIGRRLNQAVFRIQFLQTLLFAMLCVLFFRLFSASAATVVAAYLLSCLAGLGLATAYALVEGSSDWPAQDIDGTVLPVLRSILPFAVWVWVSNALTNLFTVCDRLLLINCHTGGGLDTQFLIGQYHTSCIFPSLLSALGATAGSMLMPYLSKDWESGNRDSVQQRMNLMLKLVGLICIAASLAILLIAPLLFAGIWKDKFAMGESLLPMTLSYCSLSAMTMVAQNYFWCMEKSWHCSALLLLGLVTNALLGWVLIGPYGIEGVVASTWAAHAVVLLGVLLWCRRHGLRIEPGVFLIAGTLLAICCGQWMVCFCCAVLMPALLYTRILFSDAMKQEALIRWQSLRLTR
jgi:O-antigen/teichoic acid export membrane protein